jgi:hypothetical protein
MGGYSREVLGLASEVVRDAVVAALLGKHQSAVATSAAVNVACALSDTIALQPPLEPPLESHHLEDLTISALRWLCFVSQATAWQ